MSERREQPGVARWDPFGNFDAWPSGGLFRNLWGLSPRVGQILDESQADSGPFSRALSAPLDVSENDSEYTVSVELPGISKEDITVDIHEKVLSIRAEKKVEHEETEQKLHRVERSYGSVNRMLRLPANIDEDAVKASFKDGVLTLQIPKSEQSKAKTVSIKS